MKTVKNTTAIVAVTNSFFRSIFVSSKTSARANAIAPRKPPYDIINISIRVNSSKRQQLAILAKIAIPRRKNKFYFRKFLIWIFIPITR